MIQMLEWPKFLTLINSKEELHSIPNITMSQDITKQAVALANNQGGHLILGFDRYSLQLCGCDFDGKWLNAILANEIKPAIEYDITGFIRNNKRLFVVKINEGKHKPYSIFGGSLINVKQTEKPVKAEDDISQESVKKRQNRCLEYLKKHPDISNLLYRELNSVSYKTAHNELSDLTAKKILAQVGQARNTKYVLYKNLDNYKIKQSEINLFGETLDSLIDLNNQNKSYTEIRRTQSSPQMESHIITRTELPDEPDKIFPKIEPETVSAHDSDTVPF